jgi:hypothetical protein
MANNNSNSSGGVGFFGLMFLIFMTLKLTGYITWSWWWFRVNTINNRNPNNFKNLT